MREVKEKVEEEEEDFYLSFTRAVELRGEELLMYMTFDSTSELLTRAFVKIV